MTNAPLLYHRKVLGMQVFEHIISGETTIPTQTYALSIWPFGKNGVIPKGPKGRSGYVSKDTDIHMHIFINIYMYHLERGGG